MIEYVTLLVDKNRIVISLTKNIFARNTHGYKNAYLGLINIFFIFVIANPMSCYIGDYFRQCS